MSPGRDKVSPLLQCIKSTEQHIAVSAVFPTSFSPQEIFISISFAIPFFGPAFLDLVGIDINRFILLLQKKFSFLLECFVKMLRKTDSTEPFLDIKYLAIYSILPGFISYEKSLRSIIYYLLVYYFYDRTHCNCID